MSGLSITTCYLRYLSIYGGVVEGGGGGRRGGWGAPTTPNQLWGGPACKSLRTPALHNHFQDQPLGTSTRHTGIQSY